MLLEVAAKERLIGEVHPVGDLLDIEPTVFELMLDLHDGMAVDDGLGALPSYCKHDIGKVAWSDVKGLGVKGHLSLRGAMAQDQLQKLLEKHLFAIDPLALCLREELAGAAVEMKEQILDMVGGHLAAIGILWVAIHIFQQMNDTFQQRHFRLIKVYARYLFNETEEWRF